MAIGTLAAVALGAGALGSAALGASAAGKASRAATQAADQSAAVQREIYGQNKQMLSPFVQGGQTAFGQANALLGIGGNQAAARKAFDTYRNSTGYQFRLGEGMNALNSGYAGAGTIQSGAAMKAATEYGQNFASNEFGNYMGALGNQQGVGLSAGGALAGVGTNYANSLGNIYGQRADTIGNAALANASNINSLIGTGMAGILKYGVK